MLRFMGLQRVGHDWATEMNWTELKEWHNPAWWTLRLAAWVQSNIRGRKAASRSLPCLKELGECCQWLRASCSCFHSFSKRLVHPICSALLVALSYSRPLANVQRTLLHPVTGSRSIRLGVGPSPLVTEVSLGQIFDTMILFYTEIVSFGCCLYNFRDVIFK